jgi:predicted lysophospholipase L1 biosynthesis ABC-type transport system permease subunit
VLGGLAGLIASLGAVLAGQLLNLKVFELSMPAPWWIVPTAFFGAALLVSLVGRLAIRRLLMVSPLEVLRAEA